MPLSKGTSKEARQGNIEREIAAGKDPKQAVAIGYAKQRENVSKKTHGDSMNGSLISELCTSLSRVCESLKKTRAPK